MSEFQYNSSSNHAWGSGMIPPFLRDITDFGIATLRYDGQFLHANPRLVELSGYNMDELGQIRLPDLIPDPSTPVSSWLEDIREHPGQGIKGETLMRHRNGQSLHVYASFTPVFEDSGALSHYLGIFEDISIRKLNEALLSHQSQVLKMIATHENLNLILARIVRLIEEQAIGALSTIYLLDKEGRLRLGAAPSWPETFVRAVDGAAIGPEAGSCGAAAYFGRRIISLDITQDTCWGAYREWILSYGIRSAWSTPVLGKDGSVLGTVSMCWRELRQPTERDFALVDMATQLMGFAIERQKAQDLIMGQQLTLVASSRMAALGEMAAGVAHEINNPLTIIQGYAQKLDHLAGRGRLDQETVQSVTRTIKDGVQRITKIVKGLRAIARDGENDPFQEVFLQTILDETLELCQKKILFGGIQLDTDPISPDLTLECRAVQIAQVLLNLLNNSYDALQNTADRWIRVNVKADEE